ncbi:MAG: protein-glutamate O-methyltransferase CheR [Nitrospirae bacterium]|nr:protein-glutamate O-methyltransferase CheR [Nitrospirota bacterium]
MKEQNTEYNPQTFTAVMSNRDFSRLSEVIYHECGIKMSDAKKVMLEARLRKRLRELCMKSFAEYCDYLLSPKGIENELFQMINEVTTNKTDFFREPRHFEYLVNTVLPELLRMTDLRTRRSLNIWSAGCSTGEEPYTLAMVMSEAVLQYPGLSFMILATDISTKVLEKAVRAVYEMERVETVPLEMKKKYLLRSRNKSSDLVRMSPKLRSLVRFRRLNFMEGDFGMREPMDVIFCRNVIIYFDRQTQEKLINRFCEHLAPGGYLFMGHSETLNGLNVPLVSVGSTVYRKPL